MNDTLIRLTWALPLVLVLGVVAILVLRRVAPVLQGPTAQPNQLQLQESLRLSDKTVVHLVHAGGKPLLIAEGADGQVAVHSLHEAQPPRGGWSLNPWYRR